MTRRLIYAANWKMNHGPAEARSFAARFLELTGPAEGRELWFFPPLVSLSTLLNTGVAVCGGALVRPLAGRGESNSPRG